MEHFTDFKSSNVKSLAYDSTSGELNVDFHNGSRYQYIGVTPTRWDKLKSAPSVGSFVQNKIVGRCEEKRLDS